MADSRAASRYVKSLLGLAVEKGALEQVHNDMLLFSKVCEENSAFTLMLKNPIIKHNKKRTILTKIFQGKVHALSLAIFDMLTRKNREPLLPTIASEFHLAYNEFNDIGKATIITATSIDAELRGRFETMAKQISGTKKIELIEKVDQDMIGGFILNVGDRQVDASIQNKLKAMKIQFAQNPYIKEY